MSWDQIQRFGRRGLLRAGTATVRLWLVMLSERLAMRRGQGLCQRATASVIRLGRYRTASRGFANEADGDLHLWIGARANAPSRPVGRLRRSAADVVSD